MYKYKYTAKCSVCKWIRYHPNVKEAMITELKYFNPQSLMTDADFMRKYAIPTHRLSFQRHYKVHVSKIENKTVSITNEKEPIRKVMGELVVGAPGSHEAPLKAFIAQFNEKIENRELPITVKDGLQAIKIMADIEKTKKDDKKDLLKIMMGSYEKGSQ